jgi:protein O-mannosyl-transferase
VRYKILVPVFLTVIILALYQQVADHKFIVLDDPAYVTENAQVSAGLTGAGVGWALTSTEQANWHPVTWLSHMADVQFFGMNPGAHHLTSVLIHTISSLLLLLVLYRLTGSFWQSALVAALFALHPTHVESVAWVAERKDVLSAFFCFLTLLYYCEYVRGNNRQLYWFTLAAFVLGLMSKPMLVTLPVLLLLLDYWPLGRFRQEEASGVGRESGGIWQLAREKIPFFAAALFSGLITIYAQNKGGALQHLDRAPLGHRIGNVLVSYLRYLGKTFWPGDLVVFYPPLGHIPLWQAAGSLALLLLVSVGAFRARRRHPYLLVGWLWFLVTLLPVIGLIQVGEQSLADRYQYLPSIGIFIMVAWGFAGLTVGVRFAKALLALGAALVLGSSAFLTWQQIGYWHDGVTLFQHALEHSTDNHVAHAGLGATLDSRNELDAAMSQYREALRINPRFASTHFCLGVALAKKGDLDGAIKEYETALRLNPRHQNAYNNLRIARDERRMQQAPVR